MAHDIRKTIIADACTLHGIALDWAVAQALGFGPTLDHPLFCSSPAWFGLLHPPAWLEPNTPFPSSRWAHGGELIEEYIRWLRDPSAPGDHWNAAGVQYLAVGINGRPATGSSKLQAVCRAVLLVEGAQAVEVPAVLTQWASAA